MTHPRWLREAGRAVAVVVGAAVVFGGVALLGLHAVFAPRGGTMPVYADNPCGSLRHVVFHYDDSTTFAAGGDEAIAFDVPAGGRAKGSHEIGIPATPNSMLRLEVYRSSRPDDEHESLATHHYEGVLPSETVDGDEALLLKVPESACAQ